MTSSATTNSTVTRLRLAGLRATGPRLAILRAIEVDHSHPSAESLLERLRPVHPPLSLSTVYTTLEALARAGPRRRPPPRAGDGAVTMTTKGGTTWPSSKGPRRTTT